MALSQLWPPVLLIHQFFATWHHPHYITWSHPLVLRSHVCFLKSCRPRQSPTSYTKTYYILCQRFEIDLPNLVKHYFRMGMTKLWAARKVINGLLLINPRNIISNIIMIFNINSTRGHTGSLLVLYYFKRGLQSWKKFLKSQKIWI